MPEDTNLPPQMAGTQKAPPIPSSEWDRVKADIRKVYTIDKRSMAELVEYMKENHDFHATSQQYFKKFREDGWKFRKNNSNKRPFSPEPEQTGNQRRRPVAPIREVSEQSSLSDDSPPPEDQQRRPDSFVPNLTSTSAQHVASASVNGYGQNRNPQLPAGFATDKAPGFPAQGNPPSLGNFGTTIDLGLAMASSSIPGLDKSHAFTNFAGTWHPGPGVRGQVNQDFSQYYGNNIQPYELTPVSPRLQPYVASFFSENPGANPKKGHIEQYLALQQQGTWPQQGSWSQQGTWPQQPVPATQPKQGNLAYNNVDPFLLRFTPSSSCGEDTFLQPAPRHKAGSKLRQPIHQVAQTGFLDGVKLLIDNDPGCVHVLGADSMSAIILAAYKGHGEIVELLIKHKVDLNVAATDNLVTAIHMAARSGHRGIVDMLLKAGAKYDPKEKDGETPLWLAAQGGHDQIVKMLLSKGRRPIHQAAMNGHTEVVRLLLANQEVDADSKDDERLTPFWMAAQEGHDQIVKMLLSKGANPNAIWEKTGRRPIHQAARNGHTEVVRLLLANQEVDADPKDSNGITPLFCASHQGNYQTFKMLLDRGADMEAIWQEYHYRPIHQAAQGGHLEIVRLLIENKVDLNAKEKNGGSPMMLAARGGFLEVVELLIENGASICMEANEGETALMLASDNGHPKIVKLLLDNGAKSCSSWSTWRPIHHAVQNGHFEVVKVLLSYEPDEVDVEDDKGCRPLTIASGLPNDGEKAPNRLRMMQYLLDKGAKVTS
ncbi:hypothetical protein ACJZ2D_000093 [Fusarium nematophilum]